MRKVFFSFDFDDVFKVNQVRNSWVFQGKEQAGFIDKAEFEKVKLGGDTAIKEWIKQQLSGTSVTVVLIGVNTLNRDWVKYEIMESRKKGNGIIGVTIHDLKDINGKTSEFNLLNFFKAIGKEDNKSIYYADVVEKTYNYEKDDGYYNLGTWIELSVKRHNK